MEDTDDWGAVARETGMYAIKKGNY